MKYSGELFFEDNDLIMVPSFIVRSDSEVAFTLTANWGGQGRWTKTGIATFDGHKYVSSDDPSIGVETREQGPTCKVIFNIIEKDGNFLSIVGIWQEGGESYAFEGDLEKQS